MTRLVHRSVRTDQLVGKPSQNVAVATSGASTTNGTRSGDLASAADPLESYWTTSRLDTGRPESGRGHLWVDGSRTRETIEPEIVPVFFAKNEGSAENSGIPSTSVYPADRSTLRRRSRVIGLDSRGPRQGPLHSTQRDDGIGAGGRPEVARTRALDALSARRMMSVTSSTSLSASNDSSCSTHVEPSSRSVAPSRPGSPGIRNRDSP